MKKKILTKVLVTGGAGFIGSHIVDTLLAAGHEVVCLDNLSSGKISNIQHHLKNKQFTFIEGDIRSYDICLKATKNVDYISHQAAMGSVPRSIEFPLMYEDINIKGTLNIFESARVNNIKTVVFASSSSVYGDSESLPKREEIIGACLSPYALTKLSNEQFAKLYSRLYGLNTVGLRYFNVYGPRQSPDGGYAAVIPRFITSVIDGENPIINGSAEISRDFTYVQNVVSANILALFNGDQLTGESFNIACGQAITLRRLFEEIKEGLNSELSYTISKYRKGDIQHSLASIEKARKMMGYNPEIDFNKGIQYTLEYYMS